MLERAQEFMKEFKISERRGLECLALMAWVLGVQIDFKLYPKPREMLAEDIGT